ncbi:hypothetical protein GCM10010103_67930 [Streptomyces paradoxus]
MIPVAEIGSEEGTKRSSRKGVGHVLRDERKKVSPGRRRWRWSAVQGVGDGDVDGLAVYRPDEFVETVQPGQQVRFAAQDG